MPRPAAYFDLDGTLITTNSGRLWMMHERRAAKLEALARDGNYTAARPHFIAALELSKKVGGSFRSDFLSFSTGYVCPREPALEYCH